MNLCRIVLNFYPETGGSIADVVELSKSFKPYLTKQFLITRKYYGEQYDDKSYEESSGVHVYRENLIRWLPRGRLQSLSFIPFAIRRILWLNRKYGVDIIQANCKWTGVAAFVAGKILGKPVVYMAHGTDEASGKVQGITETLLTKMFRPSHLLVMDDGSGAPKKFKEILGDKLVTVVYHGIDGNLFNPGYDDKELKERLKIENDFVVTSTSRLIPVRRVDCAISAFYEFLRISKAENAVLLIIGEGRLRNQLEKIARGYGIEDKVRFLGKVEHSKIRDYLSISDVLIATSTHNNVNRSTLEAMACSKPVLAFDSGTIRQVFSHMENCLLAKTGDVKDFATKLLSLYKDAELRSRIGENARKFVEEARSWESRIRMELKVFEKLLQKKLA